VRFSSLYSDGDGRDDEVDGCYLDLELFLGGFHRATPNNYEQSSNNYITGRLLLPGDTISAVPLPLVYDDVVAD
jgi:hypothetical protein